MKTIFLNFFTLITFVTLTSCGDKAKEADTNKAEAAAVAKSDAVTYEVNPTLSTIQWKGFKPTGEHHGTIALAAGKLNMNSGAIEAGKFVINMDGIEVLDLPKEDDNHAKLTTHLKSDDFFDVQAYPNAKFIVTGATTTDGQTQLSGNLTLKETTNNISFPVKLTFNDKEDIMTLTSETFTIDRSKWNVKYGSKSFFDNLGDKFINDDIEITISLVAEKL
ncbi:YceI family protein [Winogradskyella rapida]|uniref:YceI family protein n=1 Tax=Winogradskyella rapida TaxID=549701 RepID=A0ABW3KSH8_9FLAO